MSDGATLAHPLTKAFDLGAAILDRSGTTLEQMVEFTSRQVHFHIRANANEVGRLTCSTTQIPSNVHCFMS